MITAPALSGDVVTASGMLDSGGAWMTLGAVLIVAAISGQAGTLLGKPMPVFSTLPRQLLAALAGLAALAYGYLLEDFRVTKLTVQAGVVEKQGACPVDVEVSGTIRVAGGAGPVTYRFVYPHRQSRWTQVDFDGPGGKSVIDKHKLTYAAVEEAGIDGEVKLQVSAPDFEESEPVPFAVTCRRPADRGLTPYRTDGYSTLYPHGWKIVEDDVVRTTYHRSKFVSPDGDYFVLIDWTPGVGRLGKVPDSLGPGYELIGIDRVGLGSRRALKWRFRDGGEERVNYMFVEGGDSYAVLAGGYDIEAIDQVARVVAKSVSAR